MYFDAMLVEHVENGVDILSVEFASYNSTGGFPTASTTFITSEQTIGVTFSATCIQENTIYDVSVVGAEVARVDYNTTLAITLVNVEGTVLITLTFSPNSTEGWPDYSWHDPVSGGGGGDSSGGDWGLGGLVPMLIEAAKLLLTLALDALMALLQVYPILFIVLSVKYWVTGNYEGWLEFIYMHINAARTLLRFILDIIDQILPT